MTENVYFFDSYAIIEIILGNSAYKKYVTSKIITTRLNLFEVHYAMLRLFGIEQANVILSEYAKFVIDYDFTIIAKGSLMKLEYKKSKLSMTDCIGYMLAKKLGIKFLTGYKEFEKLSNV